MQNIGPMPMLLSLSIIINIIVQKVHYEKTKNTLRIKIVQRVKAIEQLCKVLKLFH